MRPGWRDAFRTATDLAVLGFLTVLAALPVVTAGAALLTASQAIDHYLRHDSWPSLRTLAVWFRRSLLPGLAPVAVTVLLVLDLLALRAGRAPGGAPMVVLLALVCLAAAGFAGRMLVLVTRSPFSIAVREAAQPGPLAATAAVLAVAGLLAVLVHPILVPVLLGHALFALHVMVLKHHQGLNRLGKRGPVSDG